MEPGIDLPQRTVTSGDCLRCVQGTGVAPCYRIGKDSLFRAHKWIACIQTPISMAEQTQVASEELATKLGFSGLTIHRQLEADRSTGRDGRT